MPHQNAYYVPLTAEEQDVINRMVDNEDLYVEVVNWGYHPRPKITSGDKRIQIRFPMEFCKPVGLTVPVTHFQLRLKMRNGKTVAETVESTVYNNSPLMITAGMRIDLVWDLAIDSLSDNIKKQILPSLKGKKVASIKNNKLVREPKKQD